MTQEDNIISSLFKKILKPKDTQSGPTGLLPDNVPEFRWFTLVTIPETKGNADTTIFADVANWTKTRLESKRGWENITDLEIYLTHDAMLHLTDDISIDRVSGELVETVKQRIFANRAGAVAWSDRGINITPALEELFNQCFVVRHLSPPHVYVPADESKIPSNVDQILIGVLKVEDGKGMSLGETPIRALLQSTGASSNLLRMQVHTDFDLLLKAFPGEKICTYPLGVNIRCDLEIENSIRKVSQIDLDIHDTKLLAQLAGQNGNELSYHLLEGGGTETDAINHAKEVVRVEAEKDEMYAIADETYVPVNRKIGVEVVFRYTNSKQQVATDVHHFLFRFFKYALKFTPTSLMKGTGQFVHSSVETTVMLPPMFKEGIKETQSPGFIIQPVTGSSTKFELFSHPDSPIDINYNGQALSDVGTPIELLGPITIKGSLGQPLDTQYEDFTFILRPLGALNNEQQGVANRKPGKSYGAFVEIKSNRALSLSGNEIVLGRGRYLYKDLDIGPSALTLERKYVNWKMFAGSDEQVFYYNTVRGTVKKPLTELSQAVNLGLIGTYYVYVDDFEFRILLESTPRTEIALLT